MVRECPQCGKGFEVLYPDLWGYKEAGQYVCTWTCLRQMRKEKKMYMKMKKDGTPAKKPGPKQKTETPMVKLSGALTIEAEEPEKVDIAAAEDKEWTKYEPEAEKTPEAAIVEETKKAPRITKPLTYEGLEVTAVNHPVLGEFYFDKKFNSIDWRSPEGDEVSMPPFLWMLMVMELPKILNVLGVDA